MVNFLVLTPVNEYNIVDKIQSANNLLFSSIEQEDTMNSERIVSENNSNKFDEHRLHSKHRVTFSSDIEEYEDEISDADSADVQYKDDIAIDNEVAEIIERDERASAEQSMKRMSIEEVLTHEEDSLSDDNIYHGGSEIVEEINDMLMEGKLSPRDEFMREMVETPPVPITEAIENALNQSTNETVQSDAVESVQRTKMPEKERPSSASKSNNVPPCRACTRANGTNSIRNSVRSAPTNRPMSQGHRVTSAIKSASKNQEDILRIHLNVRSCCENKYLDNDRLPRYNGYISQYGLSKDQLELREQNRQKYFEQRARREREIMRAKQQISDLNEQAFRQWLVRKNHLARPRYKNMYDVVESKPKIKYNPSATFRKLSRNSDNKRNSA